MVRYGSSAEGAGGRGEILNGTIIALSVFVVGIVLGYVVRPRWERARYVVDNAVELSQREAPDDTIR